jgi:hypothetical protein
MLESLQRSNWRGARAGKWVTIGLAVASLATAVRAYPNYFPFLNSLAMGRPGYLLVNDSNLDWNQSLPEVENFVRQRGLDQILLDEYGFSEPTAYVPQAQLWFCQQPSPADGGRWAVVSANNLVDGSTCPWLMLYPHEALAGSSMYAIQLPQTIPAAGAPGGPPLPKDYRYFGGAPFDVRGIFSKCIRDPEQLQPTMDRMQASYQAAAQKKK